MGPDLQPPNPLSRIYDENKLLYPQVLRHGGYNVEFSLTRDQDPTRSFIVPQYSLYKPSTGRTSPLSLEFPESFQIIDHDIDNNVLKKISTSDLPVVSRPIRGSEGQPEDVEIDTFLSSTLRFGAQNAPFHVFSQGEFLVFFRASISADHPHNIDESDVVSSCILVDFFSLDGNEIRVATDVDGLSLPTKALRFTKDATGGFFSVLPLAMPSDESTWHIFYIESSSGDLRHCYVSGKAFTEGEVVHAQTMTVRDRLATGRVESIAYAPTSGTVKNGEKKASADSHEMRIMVAFGSVSKEQSDAISNPVPESRLSILDVPVSSDGRIPSISGEVDLTDIFGLLELDTSLETNATELCMLEKEQTGLYCHLYKEQDQDAARTDSIVASIATTEKELALLRNRVQGIYPKSIPIPVLDSIRGSESIRGGILGFIASSSRPFLYQTGVGKINVRCRGPYWEFLTLELDTTSEAARWVLPSQEQSRAVLLQSTMSSESANNITISVLESDTGDSYCTMSISSVEFGLTETWMKLPRVPETLCNIINGDARQATIGQVASWEVSEDDSAVYIITLKEESAHSLPTGSIVIVHGIEFAVHKDLAEGSQAISISLPSGSEFGEGFALDEPIMFFEYDYKQYLRAGEGNQGRWNDRKSNLVTCTWLSDDDGQILNVESAMKEAEANSPSWKPYVQNGNASKTGIREDFRTFLSDSETMTFQCTFRPLKSTFAEQVYEFEANDWKSRLSVRSPTAEEMPTAIALSADTNQIFSLPTAHTLGIVGSDFTVQVWIKLNAGYSGRHDVPILGQEGYAANRSLHLVIRNRRLYLGFYRNDLSGRTTLNLDQWYHVTFRYTYESKLQAVFVNGVRDGTRTALDHWSPAEDQTLLFAGYSSTSFPDARYSDLRIYNLAKSDEKIKESFEHLIFQELPATGLVAHYEFNKMTFTTTSKTDAKLRVGSPTDVKRESGPILGCIIELMNGTTTARVDTLVAGVFTPSTASTAYLTRQITVTIPNRRTLTGCKVFVDGRQTNLVTSEGQAISEESADSEEFLSFGATDVKLTLGSGEERENVNVEEVRVWDKILEEQEVLRTLFKKFQGSADLSLTDKRSCQIFVPGYV